MAISDINSLKQHWHEAHFPDCVKTRIMRTQYKWPKAYECLKLHNIAATTLTDTAYYVVGYFGGV